MTRSSKRAPRRDEQVALLQRADRRDRAVHAGHAQVQRVAVGERAARHQRGDDRDAGELGQAQQLGAGARLDDAAADVEHRALGLDDQPGRLAHLLGVRAGHRAVAGQVDASSGHANVGASPAARPWRCRRAPGRGGRCRRCGTPRRSRAGCRRRSVTRKLCLVIGIVMPRMSASWKASVPIAALGTWPVMATIGTESM